MEKSSGSEDLEGVVVPLGSLPIERLSRRGKAGQVTVPLLASKGMSLNRKLKR